MEYLFSLLLDIFGFWWGKVNIKQYHYFRIESTRVRVLSQSDSRIAIRVTDSRFLKNSMLIRARLLQLIHKLMKQGMKQGDSYLSHMDDPLVKNCGKQSVSHFSCKQTKFLFNILKDERIRSFYHLVSALKNFQKKEIKTNEKVLGSSYHTLSS